MCDYLRLPLAERLARWRKLKSTPQICGYPHPDRPCEFQRTPILAPNGTGRPFRTGSSLVQWHEWPAFRRVGYADEIVRLRHRGWFVSDSTQDEVARGEVYRLPHGRFIAAVADPFNDGPAMLYLGEVFTDETEAARTADSIAETYAEEVREHDAKENERMREEEEAREAQARAEWEARDVVTEVRRA